MAKQSADDFFKSMSSSSSTATESAEKFFERTSKELSGQIEKRTTVNTKLAQKESVLEPKIEPKAPMQVDFKAAQAQKPQQSVFQDKLPAANLIQTGQGIQSTLKDKVPAANLVQQTGRGPANASDMNDPTIWDRIDDFNAFGDRMQAGSTFGLTKLVDQAFTKIGPEASRQAAQERLDRAENAKGGIVADILGSLVSGKTAYDVGGKLVAPIVKNSSKGVQGLVKGAAAGNLWEFPKQINEEIGERFGGEQQSLKQRAANVAISTGLGGLTDLGVVAGGALSKGIKNQIVGKAAGGAVGMGSLGAAMGTANEIQEAMSGQQQSLGGRLKDVGKYAGIGAGIGLLGGAGIGALMRKSGIPESEIAEIAPELLALPEAQPRTIRKQLAGEIKTSTNTDPIVNPYTFALDEASPQTQRAASNAAEGRTAVRDIDNQISELTSSYEQAVIDEYKVLKEQRDNPQGVNQGQLFTDAEGNVTGRQGRLSNNPRWYQEAMKENNYQKLSNKKLYELARKHVDEGFETEAGRAPSWRQENGYDEQLQALQKVRETLSSSVKEIDQAVSVTDAPLKTDVLKDLRRESKTVSTPKAPVKAETNLKRSVKKEVPEIRKSEIEKLDEEFTAYKELRERQVAAGYLDREQASKQIKGRAMEIAAQKREIIQGDSLIPVEGGLTAKELQSKISRLESNYRGKEVIAGGREGKIKGNSFGKVVVEFPDGTTKSFDPSDIVPKNDVKQEIAKQTKVNTQITRQPKTEVKTLTREQELMNKVNANQPLTQEDIDFALSPEWNNDNLFPESVPEKSTYVKQRQAEPVKAKVETKPAVEAKPAVKKTIVTEAKKEVSTTAKKKQTPGIRANYKTMTDSNAISPTLKGKIAELDQKYATLKNADVVAKSNAQMQDIAKVEADFLKSGSTGAQHISNGYRAMQELDKAGEHARALAIADKLAKDLTEAGQTVQAASLISRLSPEGQLLNLIRTAEKNGKVVDLADSVKFKQLAETVQEATGAGKQENTIADILKRLEDGGADADDIKALDDYLKTAERKIKAKPVKDRLPKELNDVKKRDKVISFLEAQEAAAQARINKRRGRLNSMPVDEWIDYSILIAAKVGKGIIKAETHIEDLVKLFGEDIRPLATQVFEKAQELVGSVTKGTLEGDFIKADNAFKRITGKASMNQQERVVEKYVAANQEVTPKDIESLRKLSKSLTELQGLERTKADIAMQKILVSYEKSSVNDKVNALRYMAMLLNDSTQAINALSGPIMATWGTTIDVIGTMMDIAMRGTLKTQRSTTLYGTNPLRFMADYFKYAKVGGKAGWEGVNPSGIQGTNEIRGLAFKSKKNPFGIAERTLGAVAKGADYATYKTVYESELRKQGFLDALENGIKRSDKEGIKNHVRKFMNDPPEAAMEQADRIGKNTTFQRNDSVGGKTANWINSAPKAVKPAVNAVVPFVRTPLNIASSAVTATPVGIVKGLFQLSSLSKASQREAIRTLSMGIVGTGGVTSLGYYLSSIGIITGANDTGNKDVNSINEQAGRGKYRFNTSAMKRYMMAMINGEGADAAEKAARYQKGDKAFDYNKLQPLAFPLAIGAGLQEKKGTVPQKLGSAGTSAFGSLFGMSSLKGIQDTLQPQYTGSQGDKAIKIPMRIVESYFKSFSPSALAQEARRVDPIQRKTAYNEGLKKDLLTYYASRIPGLSKSLPANKDTLGNTKMYPKGIVGQHLNPYKSEVANYSVAAEYIADLIVRTGDQTIAPAAPQKYIEGYNENDEQVKITLPAKRYEQLQEETGAEITKRIIEIETDDDNEAIELIEKIYSEVKEEQREKLRDEFGLYSK